MKTVTDPSTLSIHEFGRISESVHVYKVQSGFIYFFYETDRSGKQSKFVTSQFVPKGENGIPVIKTT